MSAVENWDALEALGRLHGNFALVRKYVGRMPSHVRSALYQLDVWATAVVSERKKPRNSFPDPSDALLADAEPDSAESKWDPYSSSRRLARMERNATIGDLGVYGEEYFGIETPPPAASVPDSDVGPPVAPAQCRVAASTCISSRPNARVPGPIPKLSLDELFEQSSDQEDWEEYYDEEAALQIALSESLHALSSGDQPGEAGKPMESEEAGAVMLASIRRKALEKGMLARSRTSDSDSDSES